ncbi:MAG: phosphoenolpyruvate--protein phosphotransferase [Candidatus Omnitrophica bacterium 4484_49]|nr:MAG: phosphoenolpyruvate--protein phosphotransferase [Candidatus Omnitrophica bacterium 4484_49]
MFKKGEIIRGIPASPGIAIGKAYVISDVVFHVEKRTIKEAELSEEIKKLEAALLKTKKEIQDIQKKMAKEMGAKYADIFDMQLMLLEDRVLLEEVIERLRKELLGVEYIFYDVLVKYKKALSKLDDAYLKERAQDIDDFGRRVLKNLMGKETSRLQYLKEKAIIVAHDLSPSDTAVLNKEYVLGFVTEVGGPTTHTAIMAKSFEIPAVVGAQNATLKIDSGQEIIVDGSAGVVVVNPGAEKIKEYEKRRDILRSKIDKLLKLKDIESKTKDGTKISIMANIELPHEVNSALDHGADGIGLYRTEYLYLNRPDLPSEEEQYQAYKLVTLQMAPKPVVIRTLDLGGDKFVSQLNIPYEINPFMGWRAIRFCLARPDVFKIQLRALLRASVHGDLRIMFPMISSVEEVKEIKKILREVMEELEKDEIPYNRDIKIGAMIETPSAALICDHFKGIVDFFSIGTNDLIQYSIAVDRGNEKIAYLYDPAHPGVLRLIEKIIASSREVGIPVAMCGEMAGDVLFFPLLLGFGLREFSVSPLIIPELKMVASHIDITQTEELARKVQEMESGHEVREFLKEKIKELLGTDYQELLEA